MTRPRALLALIGALATLAAQAQPAPGFACVVMGRAGQQVRAAGAVVEAPVRLSNCEGATALSDGLSVCYINERRERRCRPLRRGEAVSRAALGADPANGLADTVIAMARGDVQTLPGQTRAATRLAGLPFGQVLGDAGLLAFDLTLDPRAAAITRLRITADADDAVALWEAAVSGPRLAAPLAGLRPDTWYRWVAEGSAGRVQGRFLLMGATLEAARAELRRIDADAELSPQTRAYLKAEVFNDAGLSHERLLAVAELRRLNEGR